MQTGWWPAASPVGSARVQLQHGISQARTSGRSNHVERDALAIHCFLRSFDFVVFSDFLARHVLAIARRFF